MFILVTRGRNIILFYIDVVINCYEHFHETSFVIITIMKGSFQAYFPLLLRLLKESQVLKGFMLANFGTGIATVIHEILPT